MTVRVLFIIAICFIHHLVGCIAIENNIDKSRGARQDVGNVTSSQSTGSGTAEIPVSVIPK